MEYTFTSVKTSETEYHCNVTLCSKRYPLLEESTVKVPRKVIQSRHVVTCSGITSEHVRPWLAQTQAHHLQQPDLQHARKMNKSIEQALTSLLPTLNGALPSPLVNLSTSLLAQSRSKASALKPDEEIARAYVCAHIACERWVPTVNADCRTEKTVLDILRGTDGNEESV